MTEMDALYARSAIIITDAPYRVKHPRSRCIRGPLRQFPLMKCASHAYIHLKPLNWLNYSLGRCHQPVFNAANLLLGNITLPILLLNLEEHMFSILVFVSIVTEPLFTY